jgi:ribosomal protein S18 acetylase RimI-like enzyme
MADTADLWRVLGSAARVFARPDLLQVEEEWWTAFSGQMNVNYNVACCHSARVDVLARHCLEPMLALKKPGIIMLAGTGLAAAQGLVDAGWITVAALPLMVLHHSGRGPEPGPPPAAEAARPLSLDELPLAREVLTEAYGLDPASAAAAIPDTVLGRPDQSVWGLYADGELVSCVTTVDEDGLVVIWSMATRVDRQGNGYGRRLLDAVLAERFAAGASGSLLHSSAAGERLYRQLGFSVVGYLQLWSRPRWILGAS